MPITASTRAERLYTDNFTSRGIQSVDVSEDTQTKVNDLILRAMTGMDLASARNDLADLCQDLLTTCDLVVLGCTELSLLADQRQIGENIIDPQEIALRVALKEAQS